MIEATPRIHNMSSSSRSSVSVQPRRVDPPPTTARGARVRGDAGVSVALERQLIRDDLVLPWLAEALIPAAKRPKDPAEFEDALRTLANATITHAGLIGCAIMHDLEQLRKVSGRSGTTVVPMRNHALAFAILTKTSDRLFIASKTPNFDSNLLRRKLVTFDPRIVAFVEGHQ
ncbi:MAG: hypothetical protein Q7S02_03470 [bacterium]|nr:hypothetical protein [bacterium]